MEEGRSWREGSLGRRSPREVTKIKKRLFWMLHTSLSSCCATLSLPVRLQAESREKILEEEGRRGGSLGGKRKRSRLLVARAILRSYHFSSIQPVTAAASIGKLFLPISQLFRMLAYPIPEIPL